MSNNENAFGDWGEVTEEIREENEIVNNQTVYNYSNNEQQINEPIESMRNFIERTNIKAVSNYLENLPENRRQAETEEPYIYLLLKQLTENIDTITPEEFERYRTILVKFIEFGSDIYKSVGFTQNGSLNLAAELPHEYAVPIMKQLLDAGFPVNGYPRKDILPPLFNAINTRQFKNAEYLISQGANINQQFYSGYMKDNTTLFTYFAFQGSTDQIKFLMDHKGNINATDREGEYGKTPLFFAIESGSDFGITTLEGAAQKVRLLLSSTYLNPKFKYKGKNALAFAVYMAQLESLKAILEDNRFIQLINDPFPAEEGPITPLQFALKYSSFSKKNIYKNPKKQQIYDAIFFLLLEKGARISWILEDYIKNNLIEKLIEKRDGKHLVLLKDLHIGIDLNKSFSSGFTPLTKAVNEGQNDVIEFLVNMGVDTNKIDDNGNSAIFLAYEKENNEIINYLKEKGADTSSILFSASKKGLTEMVAVLAEDDSIDQIASTNYSITVKDKYKKEKTVNAYDVAANMQIRLILSQFLETDQPKFLGFTADDFSNFRNFFRESYEPKKAKYNRQFCPICFTVMERDSGCLYTWQHDCKVHRAKVSADSSGKNIIHIHEKLYETFVTKRVGTAFLQSCCSCSFPTFDNLGHKHLTIEPPVAYHPLTSVPLIGGDLFSNECTLNSGGSYYQKYYAIQKTIEFMCYLNENYTGKISKNVAANLVKDNFFQSVVSFSRFFTSNNKMKEIVKTFRLQYGLRKAIELFEQIHTKLPAELENPENIKAFFDTFTYSTFINTVESFILYSVEYVGFEGDLLLTQLEGHFKTFKTLAENYEREINKIGYKSRDQLSAVEKFLKNSSLSINTIPRKKGTRENIRVLHDQLAKIQGLIGAENTEKQAKLRNKLETPLESLHQQLEAVDTKYIKDILKEGKKILQSFKGNINSDLITRFKQQLKKIKFDEAITDDLKVIYPKPEEEETIREIKEILLLAEDIEFKKEFTFPENCEIKKVENVINEEKEVRTIVSIAREEGDTGTAPIEIDNSEGEYLCGTDGDNSHTPLYKFSHFIGDGKRYDHRDQDELTCIWGLIEFIKSSIINKEIKCFTPKCGGYFHPMEIKPFFDKITDIEGFKRVEEEDDKFVHKPAREARAKREYQERMAIYQQELQARQDAEALFAQQAADPNFQGQMVLIPPEPVKPPQPNFDELRKKKINWETELEPRLKAKQEELKKLWQKYATIFSYKYPDLLVTYEQGGGSNSKPIVYTSLSSPPDPKANSQNTCSIPQKVKGGKRSGPYGKRSSRKTRKVQKKNKTRKARKYNKTRKH